VLTLHHHIYGSQRLSPDPVADETGGRTLASKLA
jgi:hypothetical protein